MTADKGPERSRLDLSIWGLLTEPLASSQPPEEYRRTAPLLSAFLLVLMLMAGIDVFVTAIAGGIHAPRVVTLGGLIISYALSRTRFYALAAGLALAMLAFPSYVAVLADTDHGELAVRSHLAWLILPVLLGSLLLSIRGTVVVIGIGLVGILALPFLDPTVSLRSVMGSLGFYLTASVVVIAFMYYRNRLEELRQAEVSESESRYRTLFEASPISLWEEDFTKVKQYLDGLRASGVSDLCSYLSEHPESVAHCAGLVDILGVNQATLDLFGARGEDEFGTQLGEVLGYDGLKVFREELLALIEGKSRFRSDSLQRTLVGDELFVNFCLAVAPGYEGTWGKVFVSILDITERKHAEEKLLESEQRHRALFERTNDAVLIVSLDGIHLDANQQAADLLGYSVAELIGKPVREIVAPQELADSGQRLADLRAGRNLPIYERTFLRKDGTEVPTELNAALVQDSAGRPLHIQTIARDITQRRRNEMVRERLLAALEHRSNQLEVAAQVSKSASMILDPEELIAQTVNLIQKRFEFYYVGLFLVDTAGEYAVLRAGSGLPGQQMLKAGHKLAVGGGSMIGWCVAHGQARIALDVGREAVHFENPALPETRSELALPLISRSECIGALTVQSIREAAFSGGDVAILQTMADQLAVAIENARLYEAVQRHALDLEARVAERTAELQAVNKELEAFAYSVSHDLRAPLRSIDGFSQALLEDSAGQLDATGQDYLWRVRAASQRMGGLIDDLLKLSRVTRSEMCRESVDLSALVRAVAARLREAEPGREVTFVIAEGVAAQGDERLMQVVVENLLGNAWKFTSKHSQARIEFGQSMECGESVYFVRDDGAGFDMSYAANLFGAFQRLHGTAEFEGTGIGLATVQRIIHRHSGRIWAEGAVEQGATFYFTLGSEGVFA